MSEKKELSGTIGEGIYFSDLFVQFVEEEFSGGLLIWAGETETEARIYFSKGRPFHCSGTFYEGNRIGEILKKLGMVNSDDVDLALRVQELSEEKKTELIGSLLKREAFLSEEALEAGLQIQTTKRIMECFGISTGMWHGLSSKRSDIVKKGAVIDPWQVINPGIEAFSSPTELRDFSDDLLGKSVQVTCDPSVLENYGIGPEHEDIVQALSKPRKPAHLEKAFGKTNARAILKALNLCGFIEKFPAKKGVPLEKSRPKPEVINEPILTSTSNVKEPEVSKREPEPRPVSSISKYDEATLRIISEIESTHETYDNKNYFDLLGVTPQSNKRELRAKYTEMVRKFHPDTLGSKRLSPEVMSKAADVSSRLNEAFQTLSNEDSRAEYLKIYNDARIGGKMSQIGLLDEADKKFKMAQILIKKKDFDKAREYLTYATNTIPEDGRYKASLAWSIWIDPKMPNDEHLEEVTKLLEQAVRLSPADPDALFYYGSILKFRGNKNLALKYFKKCVEKQNNHTDAMREIRLLRSRNRGQ
ncbi:MAG: DnaJ domain-containing protein [Myxococcota bacterium]|nr:DnaJ domain-containing protein [Myxococcota bacterium]